MYYYQTYQAANNARELRRFTFYIESTSKQGWVKLRMCAIEDTDKDGNPINYEEYNPEVHRDNGHYMSRPWRARRCWDRDQEEYTYKVFNGRGNILTGDKLMLSETIVRLTKQF